MTTKRNPIGIQVNGAYLRVRDPNAMAGSLFADYRTMPGLASFTLPNETGSVNETALMDGTVSAAQFAGVGTITGVVGALGAHPVHLFMEDRKNDQASVQIEIVRLATNVGEIDLPGAAGTAGTYVSAAGRRFLIPNAAAAANVRRTISPGHLIAFRPDNTGQNPPGDATPVVPYSKATPVAADNTSWQVVMSVDDDGTWIDVAPGFSTSIMIAAGTTGSLVVRLPGRRYSDIVGIVNQWDSGDFQQGSIVGGNMTFTPNAQIPAVTVEQRIDLP